MGQRIEVPGLGTVEFPDGMSDADMAAAIKRSMPNAGQPVPAPQPPKSEGPDGAMEVGNAAAGGYLNGIPILGPMLKGGTERAAAGIRSMMYDTPYADELKAVQDYANRNAENHPIVHGGAGVGGAVVSALPVAATQVGGRALGLVGDSLASRATQGAIGGAVIGGADAAVRGESIPKGAGIGGVVGGASPFVGKAVGYGYQKVSDALRPVGEELKGYSRGAINRVSSAIGQDKGTGQLIDDVARHGKEAMVLDMGPNALGHANAIANNPGEGAARIVGAVTDRGKGAAGRITADVDAALGASRDTPAMLNQLDIKRSGNAAPLYKAFRETKVHPTPELQALAPVLEDDGLFATARHLMKLEGKPVTQNFFVAPSKKGDVFTNVENAVKQVKSAATGQNIPAAHFEKIDPTRKDYPTAEAWDYVKQAIDGKVGEALKNNNRNVARVYMGLKERLINAIDNHPDPKVAGVWKAAREQFSNESGIINAIEDGKSAFKRGVDPNEMRATIGAMSQPEQQAYKTGARQHVADIMGDAVNPDAAARTTFKSPYAQQRLEIVAGPEGAAKLTNRLDAETLFKNSENTIRGNSATARRQAFSELYPGPGGMNGKGLENSSLAGWGVRAARGALNVLGGGALDSHRAAIANDASKLLTASGDSRDAIVKALVAHEQARGGSKQTAAEIERIVTLLANRGMPRDYLKAVSP